MKRSTTERSLPDPLRTLERASPEIAAVTGGELVAQFVDVGAVFGRVVRPFVDHQVVGFPETGRTPL